MTRLVLDGADNDMGSDVASRDSGQMMYLCLSIDMGVWGGADHTGRVFALFRVEYLYPMVFISISLPSR